MRAKRMLRLLKAGTVYGSVDSVSSLHQIDEEMGGFTFVDGGLPL